jgi:hypothetical protein
MPTLWAWEMENCNERGQAKKPLDNIFPGVLTKFLNEYSFIEREKETGKEIGLDLGSWYYYKNEPPSGSNGGK